MSDYTKGMITGLTMMLCIMLFMGNTMGHKDDIIKVKIVNRLSSDTIPVECK